MDHFSKLGFAPEFEYLDFGPDDWRSTLEAERPDLLLVESAWQGLDGRWKGRVARFERRREPDEALAALLAWCRERDIPTVFWGKEDPPNFDRFVDTAVDFDYIFTTDEDSIPRYIERAGHDRVALLPFGLQPRIHNPAGAPRPRPFDVAFAGSYWHGRYPDRKVQMETVLGPALDFGLHIFSRRPGTKGARSATTLPGFPSDYADHVVGSLPYESVLTAYRRYKVFLNVNSVPGSRTMCARRIFELLACGAAVVSGASPAIETLLGPGLVHESSSKSETRELLELLLEDDELREREAVRALRTLLASHTYGHRVHSILSAVGIEDQVAARRISVLCVTTSDAEVDAALASVARQQYDDLELVIVQRDPQKADVTDIRARAQARGIAEPVLLPASEGWALGDCLNAAMAKAAGDYLAIMDPASHYGPAYLTDLANVFSYTAAGAAGKDGHYARFGGADATPTPGREHAYVETLDPRTLVMSRPLAERVRFAAAEMEGVGSAFAAECRRVEAPLYAVDRFNFVAAGDATMTFEEIDV
jgi:spore maturation protein CgeB